MSKTMHFALLLVAGFALTLSSGCVIRHGDFSVVSNKLVRTADFELSKAERTKGIVGEDIKHIYLFFPTGVPTLEEAVDDALRKGNGDVVTDAVIKTWSWYIPLIYGQHGWSVTGDVVKTRQN